MKCDQLLEIVVKEGIGGNNRLFTICSSTQAPIFNGWGHMWLAKEMMLILYLVLISLRYQFLPLAFSVEIIQKF